MKKKILNISPGQWFISDGCVFVACHCRHDRAVRVCTGLSDGSISDWDCTLEVQPVAHQAALDLILDSILK